MDRSLPSPAKPPARRLARLPGQLWLPLALGAVAFAIDVLTPRGMAMGFLYVIALLTILRVYEPRSAYRLAAALTPLLLVGHVLSPVGEAPVVVALFNRSLSLIAL
jgi:hypothetical protein